MDWLIRTSRRNRESRRARLAAGQVERLEPRGLLTTVLTAIPAALNFTVGVPPSAPVTVGSFLDSNMAATAGDFTAAINWGNGTVSAGTVTESPTGSSTSAIRFQVSGTNLYLTPGTYPLTITVDDYEGDSTSIGSTAYVAGVQTPVLTPVGATAYFTAGALPAGPTTIGYFLDSSPGASAGDFTATITWNLGVASPGLVTESTSTPGLFIVSGTNLYAAANTYAISILVQDQFGDSTTIASQAVVNANTASPLSGALADVIANGPYAASGFTNTNRPTFSGLAAPFSIVQVEGRHFNADAEIPLGEAVTNGSGQWSFTSGPLATGAWIFSAAATLPGDYPGDMTPLTNLPDSQAQVIYIDLTPRFVLRQSRHQTERSRSPRPVKNPAMPVHHKPRHHQGRLFMNRPTTAASYPHPLSLANRGPLQVLSPLKPKHEGG